MAAVIATGIFFCYFVSLMICIRRCTGSPVEPYIMKGQELIVNPYHFTFTINTARCESDVRLLIVVHTSPKVEYSLRRDMLRYTWLKRSFVEEEFDLKTRIIFFMGSPGKENLQTLEYESEMYEDLVVSNFRDSYENNTYKAMSYLLWVSKFCSHASMLMKIDDDVLINPDRMQSLGENIQKWISLNTPLYLGKSIKDYEIISRDPASKWFISQEQWPGEVFPLWFQGLVYFLTPENAAELFEKATETVYMHTDDVFMGILVSKIPSMKNGTKEVKDLSLYTYEQTNQALEEDLKEAWLEGSVSAFHIPDKLTFIRWGGVFTDDNEGLISKPWFHKLRQILYHRP